MVITRRHPSLKHFTKSFEQVYQKAFTWNRGFTDADLNFLDLGSSSAGGGKYWKQTYMIYTPGDDTRFSAGKRKRVDIKKYVESGVRGE